METVLLFVTVLAWLGLVLWGGMGALCFGMLVWVIGSPQARLALIAKGQSPDATKMGAAKGVVRSFLGCVVAGGWLAAYYGWIQ